MHRAALGLLLALFAAPSSAAVCEPATVYLVRHAEKAASTSDPDAVLSEPGQATAQSLVAWFAQRPLDLVYATHLRRTQQTAMPVAKAKDLELHVLPADDTAGLIRRVFAACGKHVLVVGHSNTVPEIAKAFGAQPFEIEESEFGTVWWRDGAGQPFESERFAR